MYISEYYEMIMLCNRGKTGVLGGLPAAPRVRAASISPARRYLCCCAAERRLHHRQRRARIRPAASRRTAALGRAALSSLLSRARQLRRCWCSPNSSSRHLRRCRCSPAAAPGGCFWRAAARPAPRHSSSHRHTDTTQTQRTQCWPAFPAAPGPHRPPKGLGQAGTRHSLGCKARRWGRAGDDRSPQQRPPELPAPPEPCGHRSI